MATRKFDKDGWSQGREQGMGETPITSQNGTTRWGPNLQHMNMFGTLNIQTITPSDITDRLIS